MALTIATGFVVDDAIVMIENIARYIEEGETPLQAALKGSGQIGFTIISLTVSLIAVLIPLLFMRDVVGRLFREFAITLSVTILISARGVADPGADDVRQAAAPAPAGGRNRRVDAPAPRWFDRLIDWYGQRLTLGARPPAADPGGRGGDPGADRRPLRRDPKGFFPVQDTGLIQGVSEAPQIGVLRRHGRAPAGARRGDPEGPRRREPVLVHRRRRHQPTLNSGRLLINLKPRDSAALTAPAQIIRRIAARDRRRRRASRSTCSRCRT